MLGCDSNKASKVVFTNREYKFADPFIIGSEIATTFTFTNEGNAPLHVMEIDADCGCVATNTSMNPIPPGGTGTISVSVDKGAGYFLQNILVYTNAPATPIVKLQVSGLILPPITYPKKIVLEHIEKGEKVTKTITLTNNTENAVEIASHKVSHDSLSVTIPEKTIPAGESIEIQTVLSIETIGFYNESLVLHTAGEEVTEFSISFEGRTVGGIHVLPSQLFLGILDSSRQNVQREIQIKTDGKHAFSLLKVTADPFDVSVDIPTHARTAHTLVLSFAANKTQKGLVEGTIRIQTDHPDMPQIAIPVKGVLP